MELEGRKEKGRKEGASKTRNIFREGQEGRKPGAGEETVRQRLTGPRRPWRSSHGGTVLFLPLQIGGFFSGSPSATVPGKEEEEEAGKRESPAARQEKNPPRGLWDQPADCKSQTPQPPGGILEGGREEKKEKERGKKGREEERRKEKKGGREGERRNKEKEDGKGEGGRKKESEREKEGRKECRQKRRKEGRKEGKKEGKKGRKDGWKERKKVRKKKGREGGGARFSLPSPGPPPHLSPPHLRRLRPASPAPSLPQPRPIPRAPPPPDSSLSLSLPLPAQRLRCRLGHAPPSLPRPSARRLLPSARRPAGPRKGAASRGGGAQGSQKTWVT